MKGFQAGIKNFNEADSQILGISVDAAPSLKRFSDDLTLEFPLLSDFNKEASTAYESLYETFAMNMRGVSKRSAFVIDSEGILRYAEVLENAKEVPNFEAVRKTLESL